MPRYCIGCLLYSLGVNESSPETTPDMTRFTGTPCPHFQVASLLHRWPLSVVFFSAGDCYSYLSGAVGLALFSLRHRGPRANAHGNNGKRRRTISRGNGSFRVCFFFVDFDQAERSESQAEPISTMPGTVSSRSQVSQ